MRTFVALDLPRDVCAALAAGAEHLGSSRSWPAKPRWVPATNMHLTLAFLGEMEADTIGEFLEALREACAGFPSVTLVLDEPVAAVPSRSRATMLWARFDDPDGRCAELASLVSDVAAGYGVTPTGRPFTPHVTLARLKRPTKLDREALADASDVSRAALDPGEDSVSVPEVIVYTSVLSRSGAYYTRQGSAPLNGR